MILLDSVDGERQNATVLVPNAVIANPGVLPAYILLSHGQKLPPPTRLIRRVMLAPLSNPYGQRLCPFRQRRLVSQVVVHWLDAGIFSLSDTLLQIFVPFSISLT